jgi:hypothetical protein
MLERRHTDSRHWSQRWMRVAIVESDAVILYDLYQPVNITGCGHGRCEKMKHEVVPSGLRYRVQRFWEIDTCPQCGRLIGFGRDDRCVYLGDDEDEALAKYDEEAERFLRAA